MIQNLEKRILTGDRPTGSLHLGHYVGSLENRVKLQDEYDCYFIVADYQVLYDHLLETDKVSDNIRNIVIDWLSVGISPEKSTIFIQSCVPELAELTLYLSFLVSVARLKRNPTVKDEARQIGLSSDKDNISHGFLGFPISQAADILSIRANVVPVGEDQLAHLEQTKEIALKFNRLFGNTFPVPKALLSEYSRLPGIDGQKMSKSKNNAIYLKDSPEDIKKKVMQAYTDPKRIHATDPGHIEGNVVFNYLDAFHKDKNEVEALKYKYKQGTIGDVEVKKILIDVLNKFLKPIRIKRQKYEKSPDKIEKIIRYGNLKARQKIRETLGVVKERMHYNNY